MVESLQELSLKSGKSRTIAFEASTAAALLVVTVVGCNLQHLQARHVCPVRSYRHANCISASKCSGGTRPACTISVVTYGSGQKKGV